MPVRFACPACQQLLGVSARKVGSQITCPKCQQSITVPSSTDVAAPAAMARSAQSAPAPPPQFSEFAFDDVPAVIGTAPAVVESAPIVQPLAAPRPTNDAPFDRSLVTFSRRLLYVQAGLLLVILGVMFSLGYFIGRGARAVVPDEASQRPVSISGSVVYQADGARDRPDSQAVVIVFPKGIRPAQKIPITGLRSQDPPPADGNPAIRIIEVSEGFYLRTDAEGRFEFRAAPGVYQVLAISSHAQRPNGGQPKPKDLIALGGYFDAAPELLGPYRYDFRERRLPDESPLTYDFSR